jgi:hypothetical protein
MAQPSPSTLSEIALDIERRLIARREELHDRASADRWDARRELERVEVALRWHRAGLHGGCSICRQPLPVALLREDPATMVCSSCRHVRSMPTTTSRTSIAPLSMKDGAAALDRAFERARRRGRATQSQVFGERSG